jgi:hypothetical protein
MYVYMFTYAQDITTKFEDRLSRVWFLVKKEVENTVQHMTWELFVFKMRVTVKWRKLPHDQTMGAS